jgi:hypothetical protein
VLRRPRLLLTLCFDRAQAVLNKLDDEEKKRVALGILLVNEQKER